MESTYEQVRDMAEQMRASQRKTLTIRGEEYYAIGPIVTNEWIDAVQAEIDSQEADENERLEADGADVELEPCEIAEEGCDCDYCFCRSLQR